MIENVVGTAASLKPPKARGLPILGNAMSLRVDPLTYFLNLYQQHGPVCEIKILNRVYWVMSGIEANRFLASQEEEHLQSYDAFGGFAEELGSNSMIVAIDGPAHRHLRKMLRHGYSKEIVVNNIQTVLDVTDQFTAQWADNSVVPVFRMFQRIITEQLGMMIIGRTSKDHFDDIWLLLNVIMRVKVMKTDGPRLLKSPQYLKAKARAFELAESVLVWHRANPPVGRHPNLVDDLIAAVDLNGEHYSDAVITSTIIAAYFAGMDTIAATASFMLYAILKTPNLLSRLQAEIDAVFAEGPITVESFYKMKLLHHTAMETLRRYPVSPFTLRTVTQPFVFQGYRFETGRQVFIVNGLTHFLPEYFPNPDAFDVERYDRADYRKVPQAMTPYTLGTHTCLGAGMAEVQLLVFVAAVLRKVNLQLAPSDFNVIVHASPVPNPGQKFSVRVLSHR
jgi:cytochrome P450